jgi:FkbM family methyltransferase
MRLLRALAVKILDNAVRFIPVRLAISLEWRIQRVLGKGIGSSSVKDEIRTLQNFIEKLGLREINLFDIGANIGQYGVEFKSTFPNGVIHSFEPSALAFKDLSITANSYSYWKTYNFGFGDSNSNLPLKGPKLGSASASLVSQVEVFGRDLKQKSEIVSIKRLDNYLEAFTEPFPNIVKMDIEGYEIKCLTGAGTFVKRFKIVQFEFGEINVDSKTYFKDFYKLFRDLDFKIYRITRGKPIEIRQYNESLETFAVTNYLAINNLR